MQKKPVLRALPLLAVLAMLFAASHSASAQDSKPNVLLILADDLGFSDMTCYGGEIPTPNLDRLASAGARFSQFYNSARCCPSRASLMTGLHPHQAGIGSFANAKPKEGWSAAYTGHLLPNCVTLAEILGSSGYSTWMVGKWHMGIPGPMERGFQNYYGYKHFLAYSADQWDPDEYVRLPEGTTPEHPKNDSFYATDRFTEYALTFIHEARQLKTPGTTKPQPWFLYLAHSSPHFPVQAPRATIDKYLTMYRKGWDVLRAERLERMKKLGLMPKDAQLPPRSMVPVDREDIANGYSGQPNPAWDSLPADRREDLAYRMATYAAMVEHVDKGVGQIMADLREHGDFDNTLIIFLSDNGACYEWGPFGFDGPSRKGETILHTGNDLKKIGQPGSHQSYGSAWANLCNTPLNLYKHFCHEGGISSPLIIHWPRAVKPGKEWITDPSHLMDIVPTVCEATGTGYPAEFNGNKITPAEGRSLLASIRKESEPQRSIPFEHQGARALRKGDWKVVWGKRMPTEATWELYNIGTDRSELHNLAAEKPELTQELAEEWNTWAKRVGAQPFQETAQPDQPETAPKTGDANNPAIKDREITITCEIEAPNGANGVLVAQGGKQMGYALYLKEGIPCFDVRHGIKVSHLASDSEISGHATLSANITAETITLTVNDKEAAKSASPGLFNEEPHDRLSIGEDSLTAAGNYQSPNRFNGKIISHRIEAVPAAEANGFPAAGTIPKPLFKDPNYHGSCDPEIIWNPDAKEWWAFYTARRATRDSGTYVGTPIGVAASPDLIHWRFAGYCSFEGQPGLPDMPVTYWAPGIIQDGDTFHMFVTYKDNAEPPWGGKGVIRHYTAPVGDLLTGWKLAGVPNFTQPDPIDATLIKIGDEFRAYYRVGGDGGIQWSVSRDLVTWDNRGKCPGDINAPANTRGFGYQEAPYVFQFGGFYWMITDPHKGLAVYQSKDAITWKLQGRILEEPGTGAQDATLARHPSVALTHDRAFLVYHVEPNRPYPTPPAEQRTVEQKKSFLQIAELKVEGGILVCTRDETIHPNRPANEASPTRWSKERANNWYARQAWLAGANFVPSSAVNQLEMWQADTFDPDAIDRELGWAASIGMNTMRVFLHDIPWQQDPEGFLERIDQYLAIAHEHGIKTLLVLFDGVWNPEPKAGKQPEPRPHVHNSGWVQSPGRDILANPARHEELKPYVIGVLNRFKDDERVLAWDLFNEPDNANAGNFGGGSSTPDLPPAEKMQRAADLLQRTFLWAREVNPSQPLTAGVWGGPNWLTTPDRIERISLEQSDVISFHTYQGPEETRQMVEGLMKHGRPLLCTEYMARGNNSTFAGILPIFNEFNVAAFNWGLVDGKSQTIYPWDSWNKKYSTEPELWFHDVFRKDGTPYREEECALIKKLTGRGTFAKK